MLFVVYSPSEDAKSDFHVLPDLRKLEQIGILTDCFRSTPIDQTTERRLGAAQGNKKTRQRRRFDVSHDASLFDVELAHPDSDRTKKPRLS